jgi:uncharacterized membrane protein YgdD (TMEM256/DUF423 family)
MKTFNRLLFVFACLIGAVSVLLAAYTAHQAGLDESARRSLGSAIQLMQFHALALLVIAWIAKDKSLHLSLLLSAGLFVAGILMFSLNMALRHLAGIGGLSFLLPYGGMAFVLGWLALGLVAKRSDLF